MSAGHQAAMTRALSHLSKIGWMTDMYAGYGYYQYLCRLDDHFEEEKEALKQGCRILVGQLFRKSHLTISCTGDEACLEAARKALPSFLDRLDDFEKKNHQEFSDDVLKRYVPKKGQVNEGIMTPAEIQYVALAGRCEHMSSIKKGVLDVVRHMLNYGYLWNEVRVKGGAYGVFCQFMRNGEGFFTSYRDPGLGETLEVYRRAAEYLRHWDEAERELLKTIIGTISGIDTPKTPAGKGKRSMTILLSKLPPEVLQEERNQILSCTGEDIRAVAGMLEEIAANGNICVIGNEQHLQQSKELFDTLVTL
jgi:hypothetical protein